MHSYFLNDALGARRPLWASIAIALCLPAAAADDDFERLEEIPSALMTATDEHGSTWAISRSGHLVDSGSKLFTHAQLMSVNGVDFNPEKGAKSKENPHWLLTQQIGEVVVGRDVYYDGERGGVRYLDTFKNPGTEEVQLKVEYRNAFRNPWFRIYDAQGRSFDGKLGPRDSGIYIKMAEEREHQGVLLLLSGERSGHKPGIDIREKEIRVQMTLSVPPKQSRSIVYWVAQSRLVEPSAVRDLTSRFYRQRVLAEAMIPKDVRSGVVNFELTGGAQGDEEPHNGPLLVALAELAGRVGAIRTGQDVLWVAKESQLSGQVEGGSVTGKGRFGDFSVKLDEVAALRGGGGRGREPRVFLRDGSVIQSDVAVADLQLVGDEGWSLDLDIEQLEYLFLRIAKADGKIEEDCNLFLKLHSGDVCGIAASEEDRLEFMTPWGAFEVPLDEIRSMSYLKSPSPRYRLRLNDGSRITAFLVDTGVHLRLQRFGEIELNTSEISGLWTALGEVPKPVVTIEEIDELDQTDRTVCLLKGENLIAGTLGDDVIHVVSGTTVTALKPSEITSMNRSYEDGSELMPVFEIELKGGDLLLGTIREDRLRIVGEHLSWDVPVAHFLGMQVPVSQ